jgi:hypothetical protein
MITTHHFVLNTGTSRSTLHQQFVKSHNAKSILPSLLYNPARAARAVSLSWF